MLILYRISVYFYWIIIHLISPFYSKAKKFASGRRHWRNQLRESLPGNGSPIVWFHAASLGEFEQGRPVMEALKKSKPETKILLTFFSPSGYEIRKNHEGADWVCYMPIDSPRNAQDFVRIVNPSVAVFIKYEYWYYFLRELNKRSVPTLMVSAIFRETQLFFHPFGAFYRRALRWISYYFVQDEKSKQLLDEEVGIKTAEITGDTRFDRVITIANGAQTIEKIERFKEAKKAIVFGSTWTSDMSICADFIRKKVADYKIIIAPHNIGETDIEGLEKQFENTVRYSQYEADHSAQIMIIDNMGMLSSVYKYADYAIIGGAFRGSLHNTLEAAVYGIPIFFGDHQNNEKFLEAIGLINAGGGFTFESVHQLEKTFTRLEEDKFYKLACDASRNYVVKNSGATNKVMTKMLELLP